jgi:hypothetical protein
VRCQAPTSRLCVRNAFHFPIPIDWSCKKRAFDFIPTPIGGNSAEGAISSSFIVDLSAIRRRFGENRTVLRGAHRTAGLASLVDLERRSARILSR